MNPEQFVKAEEARQAKFEAAMLAADEKLADDLKKAYEKRDAALAKALKDSDADILRNSKGLQDFRAAEVDRITKEVYERAGLDNKKPKKD